MSATDDMGPLPRVHPRATVVAEAKLDLIRAIIVVQQRLTLTEAELLQAVAAVLGEHVRDFAATAVRAEREQQG